MELLSFPLTFYLSVNPYFFPGDYTPSRGRNRRGGNWGRGRRGGKPLNYEGEKWQRLLPIKIER